MSSTISTASPPRSTRASTYEVSPRSLNPSHDLVVRYSPQASNATEPVDKVVAGPSRILGASEQLLEGWSSAVGATNKNSESNVSLTTQIENDVVQVNHPSELPLVSLDAQELKGSTKITSPFVTANEVHDTLENELGREVRYRSEDGRLQLDVDSPSRQPNSSPGYNRGTGKITFPVSEGAPTLATDPDVVAHEQGHALLDAERPELDESHESNATHESFADGVAFFQSLGQEQVQKDTIARWEAESTSQSGLAANISEAGPAYFGTTDKSLRDLSAEAPEGDRRELGRHKDSLKFTTALHDTTRGLYLELRKANPDQTSEETLEQATEVVRSDFYRSLDFLPVGGKVSQSDLGAAMMRANQRDFGGEQVELYRREFENSGLRPVTADNLAQQAGLEALNSRISLPPALIGHHYQDGVDPQESSVAEEANKFVDTYGASLGIPQSYAVRPQRVYSNDRNETFLFFKAERESLDEKATELLGIGFSGDGELIYLDSLQKITPIGIPPV